MGRYCLVPDCVSGSSRKPKNCNLIVHCLPKDDKMSTHGFWPVREMEKSTKTTLVFAPFISPLPTTNKIDSLNSWTLAKIPQKIQKRSWKKQPFHRGTSQHVQVPCEFILFSVCFYYIRLNLWVVLSKHWAGGGGGPKLYGSMGVTFTTSP